MPSDRAPGNAGDTVYPCLHVFLAQQHCYGDDQPEPMLHHLPAWSVAGHPEGAQLVLKPHSVWLAREPVDMRQGIDALTRFVAEHLPGPWQQGAAVVFCNRAHSRIKVLQWDKHGVWLCGRRLHRGHFTWPRRGDETWQMTAEQFSWLVRGVDWQQVDGLVLPQWET